MPRPSASLSFPGRCAGFALLEVLLAILLLSLAAAAMGGMQLSALRASQHSAWRTAAVHLAADVADAARASGLPQAQLLYDSRETGPRAAPCYTGTCDAAQWLAFQHFEWSQRLRDALPGGRLVVCADGNALNGSAPRWSCGGGGMVVKLGWRAAWPFPGSGGNGSTVAAAPDAPQLTVPVGP